MNRHYVRILTMILSLITTNVLIDAGWQPANNLTFGLGVVLISLFWAMLIDASEVFG